MSSEAVAETNESVPCYRRVLIALQLGRERSLKLCVNVGRRVVQVKVLGVNRPYEAGEVGDDVFVQAGVVARLSCDSLRPRCRRLGRRRLLAFNDMGMPPVGLVALVDDVEKARVLLLPQLVFEPRQRTVVDDDRRVTRHARLPRGSRRRRPGGRRSACPRRRRVGPP